MKIIISGQPGSGKSTVAKFVAERLGFKHYSSGDFQRELAKERGLTIKELGDLEAKDPALDKLVDKRQEDFGKTHDSFVMDSWLGAKFIPDAVKILLVGSKEKRAKRIFGDKKSTRSVEKYSDLQDAIKQMEERDKTNIERWMRYYNFDYTDKSKYDLVVDTTNISAEKVVEKVLEFVKKLDSRKT